LNPPKLERFADVAERRTQAASCKGIRDQEGRHGLAGGADRPPDRAHQWAHGALQAAQERQPFAARPAQDGEPAPPPSRPRQGQGREALSEDHRAFGNPPLAGTRCPAGASSRRPETDELWARASLEEAAALDASNNEKRDHRCSRHNAWKSSGAGAGSASRRAAWPARPTG